MDISRFYKRVWLIAVLLTMLSGCSRPQSLLETISRRGELRVVTIYSPATYYIDTDSETGFEYELARLFADRLDVDLNIILAANKAEMIDVLLNDGADVAVGLLKKTFDGTHGIVSGPDYYSVKQQIIYKNGIDPPRGPDDLYPFQLHIARGLITEERLKIIKQQYPDFSWKLHQDQSSSEMMELIQENQIAYAAVYSNELMLAQQTYPELRVGFDISEQSPLAWFVHDTGDASLIEEMDNFFEAINQNENLAELIEYFYGPVQKFDYVDQRRFIRRYDSRLPQYEPYFREAAGLYDFDWRLLAAMSYQESHWNERARSPTGVRGLMMLTLTTARQVGIKNRLDPKQSILGGAKYINELVNRIPERIQGPERIWFALAAYNIGFGHLEDARIVTQKEGGNPDKWQEVKHYLPYLQNSDYYKQTLYGYARGSEAVSYVEGIRKYYNTLIQLTHEGPESHAGSTPPPHPVELDSLAF